MPASLVATSSGIAGSQGALAAGQAAASSKSRPSFAVAASGTEYVEWTVATAGTALLSWLGQAGATASVATNGADQAFVAVFPSGSSVAGGGSVTGGRRQFQRVTVASGDVIRLTIAADASAKTISPLLHLIPPSGPWDAHVVFGASREDQGMGSGDIEGAVIAAYATRDPIVFNYAKSSDVVSAIVGHAATAGPVYAGVAYYALLGSIVGNNVTGARPYDSGQKAALDASIASIAGSLSGYVLGFGNTSYRNYTTAPAIVLPDQSNGSAPYNDAVIHPAILAYAPDDYDAALLRGRIDEYSAILKLRGTLTDDVHGAGVAQRALWTRTWFARVYAGSWAGVANEIEAPVAAAEAAATTKATALALYNEGNYAVTSLAASSAKTAFVARLAAIYPTALFYETVRLTDVAVAAVTQLAKDAAQAALNAAQAAGYSGGTAPNTLAAQQARIDAIVISSVAKRVKIGFGTTTATSGWNKTNATAIGVAIANLVDDTGAATGWGLEITNAGTANGANGAQGAAGGAEFPDAILLNYLTDSGNSMAVKVTGLNPAKTYNVRIMGSRAGTGMRNVDYSVNGGAVVTLNVLGNVGTAAGFASLAPNGSNELVLNAARGLGNTIALYFNGVIVEELA